MLPSGTSKAPRMRFFLTETLGAACAIGKHKIIREKNIEIPSPLNTRSKKGGNKIYLVRTVKISLLLSCYPSHPVYVDLVLGCVHLGHHHRVNPLQLARKLVVLRRECLAVSTPRCVELHQHVLVCIAADVVVWCKQLGERSKRGQSHDAAHGSIRFLFVMAKNRILPLETICSSRGYRLPCGCKKGTPRLHKRHNNRPLSKTIFASRNADRGLDKITKTSSIDAK